jgi:hypothetical protein
MTDVFVYLNSCSGRSRIVIPLSSRLFKNHSCAVIIMIFSINRVVYQKYCIYLRCFEIGNDAKESFLITGVVSPAPKARNQF